MACQPHNESVDVYAFGMTLWEMWARVPPYSLLDPDEAERMRLAGEAYRPPMARADLAPSGMRLLIARCWQADPADRPTIATVVQELVNILRVEVEGGK